MTIEGQPLYILNIKFDDKADLYIASISKKTDETNGFANYTTFQNNIKYKVIGELFDYVFNQLLGKIKIQTDQIVIIYPLNYFL